MTFIDGHRVLILPHAVERYAERGCRHDDLELALAELLLLKPHGRIVTDRPDWVLESNNALRTSHWLLLGDDIAFPLEQPRPNLLVATTCICHAGLGEHRHANRNKRRSQPAVEMSRFERRRRRDQQAPTIEEEAA